MAKRRTTTRARAQLRAVQFERNTTSSRVRFRAVELVVAGPINVVRALASSLNASGEGGQLELALTVPRLKVSVSGNVACPDCGRWNYHLATCARRSTSMP